MTDNIEVLIHSSIRITGEKTVYIDPFRVNKEYNDADFIFVTHDHYDHYSEEDIDKAKNDNTIFVVPKDMTQKLQERGINSNNIISVIPNEAYNEHGLKFETIPAYNSFKPFHPKRNGWVRIYH